MALQSLGLAVLVKMETPDGDVRLCDGGWFDFDSERYLQADPVWGTLGSVTGMNEGIGNEVPALQMTLLPPGTTEPGDLDQEGMQLSESWWWIAEYDAATGLIVGEPELHFPGQVDQCSLEIDPSDGTPESGERRVAMSHVSTMEVLFTRNTGNSLNGEFHKSMFAGELGHDEATGLSRPEAWGATNPSAETRTAPVRPSFQKPYGGEWL
jgi:hypothetical protein